MQNFSSFFKKPYYLFVSDTGFSNSDYGIFCGRPSFTGFLSKPELIAGFKDIDVEEAGSTFGINALGQCILTLSKDAPDTVNKFSALFDAPEICNITLQELETVAATMADKDIRHYLRGVFLCPTGALVSTDGHRITVVKNGANFAPAIVPRDVILSVIKLAKQVKHKEQISIRQAADCTGFFLGDYCVIGKNVDGKYPDYRRVLPTKPDFLCNVNPAELARWLKSVAPLVKKDKLRAVCFDDAGGVFVQHEGERVYFAGQGAGVVLSITFDYLLKLISLYKKEKTVTLRTAGNKLMLERDNAIHVIMGMKV
jgi:hypothetical protein